jgi:hypothetical protein
MSGPISSIRAGGGPSKTVSQPEGLEPYSGERPPRSGPYSRKFWNCRGIPRPA